MSEVQFVLASRNPHKLKELETLLGPRLEALPDDIELPPENGATFAENAKVKALAVAIGTGRAAIADDSGIVVPALGGRPGVHSARFAGKGATDDENLGKLLRELRGNPDRRAMYVCALALAEPGSEPEIFEARCEGLLTEQPRGSGGFGYDPIFVPDEYADDPARTMAELSPAEKDAISHRGRAARSLLAWLATRS